MAVLFGDFHILRMNAMMSAKCIFPDHAGDFRPFFQKDQDRLCAAAHPAEKACLFDIGIHAGAGQCRQCCPHMIGEHFGHPRKSAGKLLPVGLQLFRYVGRWHGHGFRQRSCRWRDPACRGCPHRR